MASALFPGVRSAHTYRVVRVDDLGKRFGDRWIFRQLQFELAPGQVLGVLGPNGCGKSTLLSIIAGLILPTEGQVHRPARIGYAALAAELYAELTVAEHLEMAADLRGCPARRYELLQAVGLAHAADYPAKILSSGMRARLKLALAIQDPPDVLVLDEPSAGLDAEGRGHVEEIITQQAKCGAVVLATNDPSDRKLATHELTLA